MARINFQDLGKRISSFLKENKNTVMVVLFALLLLDILFLEKTIDWYIFGILAISFGASLIYKYTSQQTFMFCLVLVSIMSGFYIFTGASVITEKAAVWLIFYWIFGASQRLIERL